MRELEGYHRIYIGPFGAIYSIAADRQLPARLINPRVEQMRREGRKPGETFCPMRMFGHDVDLTEYTLPVIFPR